MTGPGSIREHPAETPRVALVLAAGLGTRLRPLTWKTPKPLMTVWGTPLVDHALSRLLRLGVRSVVVNTHWRSDVLQAHLDRRWRSLAPQVSFEPVILGTGGALLPLRERLEAETSFWMVNADVLCSADFGECVRLHAANGALATLWLTEEDGPRTVETDRDGRIRSFRSPRAGSSGTATFTGVHLVSPRVFRYLDNDPPISIVTAYERALAAGEVVQGIRLPGSFWCDSGTPRALLQLHRDIRERARAGRPGGEYYRAELDRNAQACVAEDAVCEPGALLEDCVLGPASRVASGVCLRHCIVGPGVSVCHDAEHAVLARPADCEDARVQAAVTLLGWDPGRVTVEALDARGSDRAYFRLAAAQGRAMLAVYGSQRAENERYAPLTRALAQAGVAVPQLLGASAAQRWLVLEDLGRVDLLSAVRSRPRARWPALYGTVLEAVVRFHRLAPAAVGALALEPAFGPDVYRWERELFAEHLLRRRCRRPEPEIAAVLGELAGLATALEGASEVVVHRDLQSSNIFLRDEQAVLIDYQGMRRGPAAYDLASLLCDPYVALPSDLRRELLDRYCASVPWGEETRTLFPHAAAQRLVQALGAYARLAALEGTGRFADCIPPAAQILAGETGALPGLRTLRQVLATL